MNKTTILTSGSYLKNGKYLIQDSIGQGSFGITYLATTNMTGLNSNQSVGIKVAIKEFYMSDFNGRSGSTVVPGTREDLFVDYKKRFIKEAETLCKLIHPNIVSVIDLFEENNTAYYVMGLVEGGSLNDLIKKRGRLSVEETLSIAADIMDGLEYMHSKHFLHLDLKPLNIMLTPEHRAILIDFGLSKKFDEDGHPETTTTIGAGTPGYAPIEQSHYKPGSSMAFPATMDIYAFGATLYKMLTGLTPPGADVIINDGFPEEELKQYNVPSELIATVKKAMSPARKDRYQSVAEMRRDIQKPQGGRDVEERTIVVPNKVVPPPIKNVQQPTVAQKPRSAEVVTSNQTGKKGSKGTFWFVLSGIAVALIIGLYTLFHPISIEDCLTPEQYNIYREVGMSNGCDMQPGVYNYGDWTVTVGNYETIEYDKNGDLKFKVYIDRICGWNRVKNAYNNTDVEWGRKYLFGDPNGPYLHRGEEDNFAFLLSCLSGVFLIIGIFRRRKGNTQKAIS